MCFGKGRYIWSQLDPSEVPMNILLGDQFADFGGAQLCLLDLLPALQQRDWRLRFAIPGEGAFTDRLRAGGFTVDVLPICTLSRGRKSLSECLSYAEWQCKVMRRLLRIVRELQPRLLYINGPRLVPPAALVARRTGIPLLFHAHNRLLQKTALWTIATQLRLANARVIACCEYVASSLRPYVANVETVYNGVADLQAREPASSRNAPVIGVIGRIAPEKGQLEFIRAARLLHREWPACRFVVIGAPMAGSSDCYFRQTMEESCGLPVTFTRWRSDVAGPLRELDLLVVPSAPHDATPRVVMEAFSAEIPVVALASGGIPELIKEGHTGFLVETRSTRALADRILQILKADKELLARIVGNARRKWEIDFNLDVYRRRICSIIAESGVAAAECPSPSRENRYEEAI